MLTHRLFSAAILLTAIGLAVFWDHSIAKGLFLLMGLGMVIFAMNEFFEILKKLGYAGFKKTFIIFSSWYLINSFFSVRHISSNYTMPEALIIGLMTLIGFMHVFRSDDFKQGILNLLVSMGAFLYICWPLSFLVKIYFSTDSMFGPYMLLFLVLSTKMGDVGGYTLGMLSFKIRGKNHKMVPKLSPGKSWEGFIGSLIFSMITAYILIKLFDGYNFPTLVDGKIVPQKVLTWVWAIPLGLIFATFGLMGDLAESVLKRASGIKDSGKILPGMGGMMDVLDSLILVSPLFYAFLQINLPM
jgi:phosphatidate cytidylyltransferase